MFFPFHFAVGWGPRSFRAERELARLTRLETEERLRRDETREAFSENERLRGLVGFHRRSTSTLVPATVIGRGRGRHGDLLITRVPDPSRVTAGVPVVGPNGLIGRVASVQGDLVRVEGLKNRNVVVSVVDQRSREEGILKWQPERRLDLAIQGVSAQADWQAGDRVVTSGLGSVFPRGLLVGYVAGAEPEGSGLLLRISVTPAASIARAEEVFLLFAPEWSAGLDGGDSSSEMYPTDPERELSRIGGEAGAGMVHLRPVP